MCVCDPNVRTPFCGKPGCEWPPQSHGDSRTDEPTAHTLTLEFGRFLTDEEFRTVVERVKADVPYVSGLRANAVADAVHVGDRIRFSMPLLRQIHDGPDHHSVFVTIARIDRLPNGLITLLLTNAAGVEGGVA
jgi:hypothetical protein